MRTDSLCVDASRIDLRKDNELSWLINCEYPESPVSSFLALLTTVVYRNSYNEAFSLPLYLYTSKYSSKSGLENLAEDFVKKSFTFDSNINPTLPELSRAIASTLASSASAKTQSNYDEIAGIIVCLSEKPLSQEMLDAAETLHNQTNSELTCLVTNTDESVEISFLTSNSSRYQRIPEYLCNLANAVGKNPHQCIHNFNILSPEEIQQQLIFGRGEKVSLADRPVYQNIEAFAVETPRAIAVSCGQEQLTYGELNHQANQLAHFLLEFPVEIGDKVVAFLERSTDIIKAIFAIHKVGAVYVPIDPAFPKERIRAILTEVNPKLILTNSDAETVLEDIDIPRLNLKNSGEMLDSFPSNNPEINFQIESESHIFFTSGTTGKPKGVLATHRNLVQYLSSAVNRYKFSREDKFISAARFTFSISLFKILTPLYVGGSVRILPQDVVLNLPQLCQELQKVTVFHFGPSLLKQLLPYIEENFPDFSPFNQLRHVSSGGDMVPPEVLEKLKKIFVNAEVYVIYGSSEISCMGCTYEVSRDITLVRTKVGKPHQNMSVRLFDKHGNMVPIGAPGKLYFSGDGLVKGYLHQEQLTAEKFTQIDGDRFYSIGDIGRFDTEGNIELLGRDDFQVQIRGMRVELPEIEYYLKRFPAIADCVVVSKLLDKNTEPSLVAYLVFKPNTHTDDAEIREYLYNVLPDYMVPNIFVKLDKLPTNLNGKIDRSALPNPERNKDQELVKPRNPVESHLAQIWQDVLGFEVGIDRDFLSLGGHSLQATQIVSRIRDVFHVDIPVSAMLQNRQKSALANIISLADYVTNITQSESFRKVPALQPVSHGDELPLTSYQERIWLLAQRAGKYAIHNLPMVFHLAGDLNIPCLEAAFNQVIQRHQSLRTVFPLSNHGLPIQKILPEVKLKISVEEIAVHHLSNEQITETIDRLINTEVSKYFNLEKDALIRVKLLNLSRDNHILIITCHHIISDGWSLAGVLLNEISAYYNFLLGQGELELPELKINYGDYTLWHQAQEQATEDLFLEYWTNQLQGALPLLSLPTDRHRPHSQTFQGSIQYFEISQQVREKIEQIAQKNGATLFMVLLAAFQVVLHRYSNQEDIVIGTPIGNRNYTALEHLIGCFINVVPLRSNIEHNPSFLEFLEQVKQVSLDAYTYPNFPVEKMLSTLKNQRDASYSPWFQVLFILLNVPANNLELSGIKSTENNFNKGAATFDLTFLIEQKEQGLKCSFEYNTDLYNDDTISRLIGHFQVLLQGIISSPETSVKQLPLLTESEKQQLLIEWNDTTADYPRSSCIHQLFESQVAKTPDAVAVVFEDKQLTYRQLNNQANQLAHYLQSLGVGPEVLVGISVERSLEMIVGLLGILKAGGAYVPLDPSYPADRVEYILSNSEAPVLITSSQLLTDLPKHTAKLVCLDKDFPELDQEDRENPHSEVNGQNLAYAIYTSGSTGKPKGVQICHESLVNFIHSMKREPGLNSRDRLLAVTTISFDIHTLEIYLPLTVGATIILVSRQVATDGVKLAAEMAKHDVTVMQATPATWRMLLTAKWAGKPNLKAICGGEALPQSLANNLLAKVACLWNIYGPTETTVWSTTGEVKADREHRHADAPESIGRAIANTEIYILDRELQPVAIGIPGELHIGGAGLARGYIKRPELTAEKFIPNPFNPQAGSRLYKTGDLVRYLPDGNIEYIGRIDNQVKIRGFRIELGEIESVLLQHPQIREGVVIVREDRPGDKRLVAYYVAGDTVPATNELRSFIKQKLPDYMVPAAFVNLESLPLTPNGKIDRRALPAPDMSSASETAFVPPSNPTEEKLAAIWSQILGIEKIGIHNNFFELGGHSLKATQVISAIRETFGVELLLRHLFSDPTVAELAQIIDATRGTSGTVEADLIKPRKADAVLALSFAQERLWFLDRLEGESATYNMASAWQLEGTLSVNALESAVNEIIRRHESLRTTFTTSNGVPIQVIAANKQITIEAIDLQQIPETEQSTTVQQWVSSEAQLPFNLATDSLIRVKLLRLSSESYLLTITIHHIVFDGWSMGVFLQELSALYKAFSCGETSPLPELPIQYGDYALWQRGWLKGDVLESQLNYWQQQLKDAPPLLELPLDRTRPSAPTFTGKKKSLILSQSLSQSIKALSQQEGVTIFMTLLAAFKVLLSRYTGSQDIAIGTPVAGRNRAEIEPMIGFFINTVVLRTDLDGNPTFRELLGRVREVTLGAYEHQEMPFEKLVEELQPERSGSYNPIFQVWFNLLNLKDTELELYGLKVDPISREDAPAKFDLNMYVRESQQSINLELVYNADLFDAARIEEMLHQYQYLLEKIVVNDQAQIANLSLVTTQAEKLLPSPIEPLKSDEFELVHTRFSDQAKKSPQKLAVVDASSSCTYAELEARSNQLANYLLANGMGRQEIVAIYADRNSHLVVAILGILKAGASFMILDRAYPTSRLIDCWQIAQPSGWIDLTENSIPEALSELVSGLSCRCSLGMTSDGQFERMSSDVPLVNVNPDDLAYVAFTSGSTGKPKGIKGSHKPLSHFLQWHTQQFNFHESDRFSLLSGLAHDPLLRDIFTPLWLGATLYIPSTTDIQTPGKLADWMQEKDITIAHLTPAMGQLLSQTSLTVPSLRYVFFGGDVLIGKDVVRMKQLAPNATCVNFYGTTETPQAMGYFVIPEFSESVSTQNIQPIANSSVAPETLKRLLQNKSIPLGQGIEDVQLLILNQYRQLAGIGELGEIYVRTPYLSQGYLGAEGLTQERFILNPFTKESSDRLYKTGDLARYLPDGNIEYVGRIDNQVKIRGFRIELGEIEAALGQHPQVKEAVVIAREDNLGDKRLVAYLVPSSTVTSINPNPVIPVSTGIHEWRDFLKTKLPDYMLPSAFVILEKLPLTPNGKIDRRSLPEPDISTASESTFVAPRDDLELRLTQIWQKILGVTSIGVKDNFFDLGGHSLIAVQLFAEIQKSFGKNLPLATLFQAPTIEQLAHICRDKGWTAPWRSLVTIQPQGSKPPLFFVHGIYGNVLYFRELADYLGSDQPFYGLQAKGLDGKETPYTSLEEMAAHYVQEMREFQPTGPYFIGGHSFGCIVAFEVAQQLYAQGQEVALLALLDQAVSRNIQVPLWDWLSGHVKNLLSLGYPEQVAYVVGRLQAKIQHKIPQQIRQVYKNLGDKEVAEHKERYNTVMQANIQAINDYELQVYPGKVTLFRAKIGSPRRYALDPIGGWGEFALGGVDAIDVPGDHMTLIKEPHLPVLAAELKACLDKAQDNKFNE